MKKQNGNNKLAFNKVAVAELNSVELKQINGGTSVPCVALFAAGVKIGMDISDAILDKTK